MRPAGGVVTASLVPSQRAIAGEGHVVQLGGDRECRVSALGFRAELWKCRADIRGRIEGSSLWRS